MAEEKQHPTHNRMSQKLTHVLSNAQTSSNIWKKNIGGSIAQAFSDGYKKAYEEEQKKISEQENSDKGDHFNKEVKHLSESYQKKIKGIQTKISPSTSEESLKNKPEWEKTANAIYSKFLDNAVDNACDSISSIGKDAEELRMEYEAAIRAVHAVLLHNPELEKEVKKQILSSLSTISQDESKKILSSLGTAVDTQIDKQGKKLQYSVDQVVTKINNFNVDNYIEHISNRSVQSLANKITNSTFGKLSKLPIIGTKFASMGTSFNQALVNIGISATKSAWSSLSKEKTFSKILGEKNKLAEEQKVFDTAVSTAQTKAKQYVEKLEQKAINEISKFIKLDNLSIGGFKL